MKIKDLQEMLAQGKKPVIRFTEGLQDYHRTSLFEPNHMARIIAIFEETVLENDLIETTAYRVVFSYEEFEEHNKQFAKPTWFNEKTGEYDLRWYEYYKDRVDKTDFIYFYGDDKLDNYFKIVDDKTLNLYNQYLESKTKLSYVEWLECKVLGTI